MRCTTASRCSGGLTSSPRRSPRVTRVIARRRRRPCLPSASASTIGRHGRCREANALRIAVNRRPHQLRMRTTGPAAPGSGSSSCLPSDSPFLLFRCGSVDQDGPGPIAVPCRIWRKPRGTGAVRGRFVADTEPVARAGRCRSSHLSEARVSAVARGRTYANSREPVRVIPTSWVVPPSRGRTSPLAVLLPCRSRASSAVARPRVTLPARFDACRGERCSLPLLFGTPPTPLRATASASVRLVSPLPAPGVRCRRGFPR